MTGKELAKMILGEEFEIEDEWNREEEILDYGLETGKLLYVDYKGELFDNEIANYIKEYEILNDIKLATEDELEYLLNFEYRELPEKLMEVNRIIEKNNYGLFSYPTDSDFYALFLSNLKNKNELEKSITAIDERIPLDSQTIFYYSR